MQIHTLKSCCVALQRVVRRGISRAFGWFELKYKGALLKSLIVLSFLISVGSLFAETQSAPGTTQQAVPVPSFGPQITAMVELRPSFGYGANRLLSENTANLGVKITPEILVDYTQYFNLNMANTTALPSGFVHAQDGFLRGRLSGVWKSVSGDFQLDYETRVYPATHISRAAAGMIAAWRNYATLTQKFGPQFSLILQEIPVLYAFSREGNVTDGVASANPIFENRVYLTASYDITPNLNFSLPLMVWATWHREFAGAANSGGVSYFAGIWPELDYSVGNGTTLGIAYYSDNFITANGGVDIGAGLSAGVGQMVLRQSL